MAKKIIKAQMKQRQDTKANWAAANPVLLDGELGMVSDDRNLYKVGDGRTAWNDLPFRGFDGTLAQELGTSPNAAISQKAVTEKLTELKNDFTKQLEGGVITETITEFEDKGKFLYNDPVQNTFDSPQYNITRYILIKDATSIELRDVWATDSVSAYAIYDTNKNLLAVNPAPSENGLQNYTLTSAELPDGAMYLRATQNSLYDVSVIVKSESSGIVNAIVELQSASTQYSEALLDVDKQFNGGIITKNITDFEDKGKFLYNDPVQNTFDSAQYNITRYILIKDTTSIELRNVWATDSVSAYAIYDADKMLLGVNPAPSTNGLQNYTLTSADLPNGAMYLRATQNSLYEASVKVVSDYKGIKSEVAELKDTSSQNSMALQEVDKQFNGGDITETVTEFADKGKFLYENTTLESSAYNVTKFIIIDSATKIVLTNVWATDSASAYAIYDAKKNLLAKSPKPSVVGFQNYTLTSADLPSGAMYLRATQNAQYEASVKVVSDTKGIKYEIAELKSGGGQLSSSAYIALPVPELAMVNIISENLPETKTADIEAVMEFNDMQGNIIKKNIIINAQGNSTLGHAKKNFGVDIVDSKYDESHSLKFGNWVAQDSFHWKAYMLDLTRVKAMAAYDFYESILLSRGMRKDRSWKRLQLPTDIPVASGSVTGEYLAIDSGAKCHPVGFPFILFHNGSFYGIYCWQLKKHRDNYHQKKSKAEHIHLDGNISNTLLWNANGVINWAKWSGAADESASIPNRDGIEIRNPKNLILVDGSKYDGDDNRGELISTSSAKYDASNEDMVMTAKVRQYIETFSKNVYNLQQMAKGAAKKAEIAKFFDVESIIDFIIFGQITGNVDGYKKNWQWNTYDGVKWAVNAYDLDAVWGWSSSEYYEPFATFLGTDTPPTAMVIENYLDEIKARYAELRDKGIITTEQVLKPLYNYVRVIGADYYEQEYAKWPFGNADNLWRFEEWVAEAIRLTDILMDYNS